MKTNLDKLFKTNKVLENEGVDFVIDEKTSFKLRHFAASNPRVKAAMAQHYKPYARQVDLGTLEQEKSEEIQMKIFIDTCLVSWTGVEIDGKEVECNKDNALKLFKSVPMLFDTLWKHCNDFQNYREELGN